MMKILKIISGIFIVTLLLEYEDFRDLVKIGVLIYIAYLLHNIAKVLIYG